MGLYGSLITEGKISQSIYYMSCKKMIDKFVKENDINSLKDPYKIADFYYYYRELNKENKDKINNYIKEARKKVGISVEIKFDKEIISNVIKTAINNIMKSDKYKSSDLKNQKLSYDIWDYGDNFIEYNLFVNISLEEDYYKFKWITKEVINFIKSEKEKIKFSNVYDKNGIIVFEF